MFEQINERLVDVKQDLRKKEKAEVQLKDYQKELKTMEQTISRLRKQFESEKKDVEKLERVSLTNLFATLSGKKDEKLSTEQQEMIVAQHKLEEAEKTKKDIEGAMQELNFKLTSLGNVEDEYRQLLLEKEQLITSSYSPSAEKVLNVSEQEGNLKATITELDEAITAGWHVENRLEQAIRSLEKAENWGTWDMFGGGMLSSMAKHDNIDKAEDHLHQAQKSMRQFQKELLDVEETAQIEVGISGMLKFADFFFDGFIADFMVQGKIQDSLDQARSQLESVLEITDRLKDQKEEKERELKSVQTQKRELIESL
ncbi:hypothetical protein [Falsibacillus pallidus]|uniref:hypothetical protein n=1 Tax=Falsibacillus pallidus TaxID=493781 RepID=UPI003D980657